MGWSQFKADTPRYDEMRARPVKYETPLGLPSRAYFLRVPWRIGFECASRQGFAHAYQQRFLKACPDKTISQIEQEDGEDRFFWQWVAETPELDIAITEGSKKAGAMLSAGCVAIGLPGISMAVRTKDERGDKIAAKLIPDIAYFAAEKRQFSLCFDYETKARTVHEVETNTERLHSVLKKLKCSLKVVSLPGPEKGVDDFIVANSIYAFWRVYEQRLPFTLWQSQRYSKLTFPVSLRLNQRYLGALDLPADAQFIAIKAPKGTGKTEALCPIVAQALADGRRILLISHRVQLAQAICDRVGLNHISEVRTSGEGMLLGFGLCIDSLHPDCAAHFDAEYWHNTVVILDECEQLIWHLLNAHTEVQNRRITILNQLQTLLKNTIDSEHGKIILADADLSDVSIEFIQNCVGEKISPYLVCNDYQPDEPGLLYHYPQNKPDQWFEALCAEIRSGGKPYIAVQAQKEKSMFGTVAIEAALNQIFPEKKGLRIDAPSISDPGHPAYLCTQNLNEVVQHYDWVLVSPTIETGVSIDIQGHFTSVWGCFNGVTPENSARQSIARVREAVPRHVWIAKHGNGKIANGAITLNGILSGEYQVNTIRNRIVLTIVANDDLMAHAAALQTWAKMAARINAGMVNYREAVLHGLKSEGYLVEEMLDLMGTDHTGILKAAKESRFEALCIGTFEADDITDKERKERKDKKNKTQQERLEERKYDLKQRYQIEVTPDLVHKDEDGWYPQLRLYYYLTIGKPFLEERDRQSAETVLKTSGPWLPTLNRSQLSLRVAAIEGLGVKQLLDPDLLLNGGTKDEDYDNAHPILKQLADFAKRNSWGLKNTLGITISETLSPIQVAQSLLKKIGIKLEYVMQIGGKGNRQRVYRYSPPKDGRGEVLQNWFSRDELSRSQSEMHTPGIDQIQFVPEGCAA
jgi:Domain of unknown function (DUF3854)